MWLLWGIWGRLPISEQLLSEVCCSIFCIGISVLRMGTSGLTSQAYGRKDANAQIRVLAQAIAVGLISAIVILILQYPIERLAFYFLDTSREVEQYAVTYFRFVYGGTGSIVDVRI